MLELDGIHAYYGPSHVLHGVSLRVARGEIVSLLGRNGAGKSTTLKAIMNLVRVARGRLCFDGREIRGLPTHEVSRLGIGLVPEDRRIFSELSVVENLRVGERRDGWRIERVFELFPALRTLAGRPGGSLSGGEQQMLTIARTLMGAPRLLLLDEPSQGLAPVAVRALGECIIRLRAEGLTVLLSEQNLQLARRLADRAYILEKGEVKFEGTMAALDADEPLRRAHLSV
jgi:branched-chain amino acid transport system ATP-binding protein